MSSEKENVSVTISIPPASPTSRLEYVLLAAILLLGLALRIWYLSQVVNAPDFSALQQDPEVQDYFARGLLTGNWSVPEGATDPEMITTPFFRPPGYGYLLTALYFVSNSSYLAPRIFNMLLGVVAILLMYLLGRRLFGAAAGLSGAFITATYSVFIYWEGEVNDPAIFVFLVPALFWVLLQWATTFRLRYVLLAGLIFGCYGLARPNILGFGPFVALWMVWVAWRAQKIQRVPAAWVVLLATTVAVVIPVTVRNYMASGEFVPISTYFGENLLIGNYEGSDGITPWLPYLQELEGTGNWSARDYINVVYGVRRETGNPDMTHTEVSSFFTDKALDYIRSHPWLTLQRMFKKAVLLWTPIEITCNKVVYYELRNYWPLRILPGFMLVAALFWSGLFLWLRDAFRKRFKASPVFPLMALILIFLVFIWAPSSPSSLMAAPGCRQSPC